MGREQVGIVLYRQCNVDMFFVDWEVCVVFFVLFFVVLYGVRPSYVLRLLGCLAPFPSFMVPSAPLMAPFSSPSLLLMFLVDGEGLPPPAPVGYSTGGG